MIELYLAKHKADVDKDIDIAMSYASVDTSSPEAIKNSFSKSIELKGTNTNNKIFGDIFKLDRTANDGDDLYGTNFDARKRVEFELIDNGEIIDRGYFCLDEITIDKGDIIYSITLYGILGDFFYNLQSNDEGEEMTLYNLKFPEDINGDFSFNWNAVTIKQGWDNITDDNTHIVAIPCYSGTYDDFDNDTVLVNCYGGVINEKYLPNVKYKGDTIQIEAMTKYGWSLYKTDRDLDEWECRDLRSKYQRPAIKMSWVLDAINDPSNNGGYSVQWDDDILNSPYYKETWCMLSRIQFDDYEDENKITKYDFGGREFKTVDGELSILNERCMTEGGELTFNADKFSYDFTFDLDITGLNKSYYGLKTYATNVESRLFGIYVHPTIYNKSVLVDVFGGIMIELNHKYNADGMVETKTYRYIVYTSPFDLDASTISKMSDKLNKHFNLDEQAYEFINVEYLKKDESTLNSIFNKSFSAKGTTNNSIDFNFRTFTFVYNGNGIDRQYANMYVINNNYNGATKKFELTLSNRDSSISGYYTNDTNPDVMTTRVTKKMLFGNTPSPFEYLTWFTKILNLKYRVDKASKTIIIEPIYKYYIDKVTDITDKIDRGSTIVINPNVAEHKYYMYGLPDEETYASTIYNKKNKVPYASKLVDTGYDFVKDREEIFKDCIYKNGIPYRLASVFFNNIKAPNKDLYNPSIIYSPSYKYYLWDNNGDQKEYVLLGYGSDSTNLASMLPRKSDELAPKICAFDDDNSEVDDVSNVLMFFDGFENVKYKNYTLSDNLRIMRDLNNGNYCHLYSYSTFIDPSNPYITDKDNTIIPLTEIPVFNKCLTSDGSYINSWNFDKPASTFIQDGGKYQRGITIYERFWKGMLNDMWHKDAKKVECKVLLDGKPEDILRQFFYFDNAIWIVEKIEDYSPNTNTTTKVTFIKVKDKDNYLGELSYTTTAPPETTTTTEPPPTETTTTTAP